MSIEVSIEGAAAIVTINRPERRNAITLAMRREFHDVFQSLQDDNEVRASDRFCVRLGNPMPKRNGTRAFAHVT